MPKTKHFLPALFLLLLLSIAGCKTDTTYPPPIPGVTRTNNWIEGMLIAFPDPPTEAAILLLNAAGFEKQSEQVFTIEKYDAYNRAHLIALEQAFHEKATAKPLR